MIATTHAHTHGHRATHTRPTAHAPRLRVTATAGHRDCGHARTRAAAPHAFDPHTPFIGLTWIMRLWPVDRGRLTAAPDYA
eukprot:2054935-Prymnesium_polylepis.1